LVEEYGNILDVSCELAENEDVSVVEVRTFGEEIASEVQQKKRM
jgi:hypothetical protein